MATGFLSKRKGFASMPPAINLKRRLTERGYVEPDDANSNLTARGADDRQIAISPLRRGFREIVRVPTPRVDFRVLSDDEIVVNMVRAYCSDSHDRPVVRPAKLFPGSGDSLSQTVRSMKTLARATGFDADDFPELFAAGLKKKRRGTRRRRKKTGSVDLDLAVLRLDERSPQSRAPMEFVTKLRNPFLSSEEPNVPLDLLRELEPFQRLSPRSSLFEELREYEVRNPDRERFSSSSTGSGMNPAAGKLSPNGSRCASRSDGLDESPRPIIRRSQRGCVSMPPVARPMKTCQSVRPKFLICFNEPSVGKSGKWSVFSRMRFVNMVSADNESMGYRLELKKPTRHCPHRNPSFAKR